MGELVLCRGIFGNQVDKNKLSPNEEGPYETREVREPVSYSLEDTNGHALPQTFHVKVLKKFHL